MKSKVWLILPAYNEGELIEKSVNLLDDVLTLMNTLKVYVWL